MAHPLRLLILLLLGVHVSPLLLSTYDGSMCSRSSRCGTVDIRYPFYLSNATQETPDNTANFSCGYTDLKIFCQGEGKTETPVLRLEGDSYAIFNISYHNHTFVLGDADVLRYNGCPRVSHGVSFGHDWLDYTDSFDSLDMFFDCYLPDDQPAPPGLKKYQINCSGFSSMPTAVSYVFINGSEEVSLSQEYHLAEHCKQNFEVPVHEAALMGSNLPREYGAVLKRGFELEWNTQQTCYPCEQSGGRCAYSSASKVFLGCLCSGGKVQTQDCRGSGATTASAGSSSRHGQRKDRKRICKIYLSTTL